MCECFLVAFFFSVDVAVFYIKKISVGVLLGYVSFSWFLIFLKFLD